MPNIPHHVVVRPRLFSLLAESDARRVTWITAPAGSGKTCLLTTWLRTSRESPPVIWTTLDHLDRDPNWLFGRMLRLLKCARTREPAVWASSLQAETDAEPSAFSKVMRMLEKVRKPLILVFDDVQEIAASAAERALEHLIHRGPPPVRIIGSGRHRTGLRLARLALSGQLNLIEGPTMACDDQEAAGIVRAAGVVMGPEDVAALAERHHGWAAGLRLAAQGLATRQADGGTDRHAADELVRDYLTEEVVNRLPQDVQTFLLRTSVAAEISADLANELLDGQAAGRTIERLQHEGLLVVPQDPRQEWFRYHPVLREVLLATLRRKSPEEAARLFDKAAHWSARHGRVLRALEYAEQGGNLGFAAALLAEHGWQLVLSGRADVVERLRAGGLDTLARTNPELAAVLALARLHGPDPDDAEHLLLCVTERSASPSPARSRNVRRMHVSLRLLQACLRGTVTDELLAEARQLAHPARQPPASAADRRCAGLLAYYTALANAFLGRPSAVDDLGGCVRLLDGTGLDCLRRRAQGWYAVLAAWHGELATASRAAAELASGELASGERGAAERPGAAPDPAAALLAELARAIIHLERGEARDALRLIEGIGPRARVEGVPIPTRRALGTATAVVHARLHLFLGDPVSAYERLAAIRRSVAARIPAVRDIMACLDAQLTYELSTTPSAHGLEPAGTRRPDDPREQAVPASLAGAVARARLRLAAGEPAAAFAAVRDQLAGPPGRAAGAGEHSLLAHVEALLVGAAAKRRIGLTDEAADLLRQALHLAAPDRLIRPFVEAGPDVHALITTRIGADGLHGRMRASLLREVEARGRRGSVHAGQPAEPLTDSEKAVLRYLPSLMVNDEIAAALFVSVNTVKTHLRAIYRKLGVTNRRNAVAAADALGLL